MAKVKMAGQRVACVRPFLSVELDNIGRVFTCCNGYIKFPIGNIFEQSFEEIWNGERAREIRRKMLAGDLSCCNMDICNTRDLCGERTLDRNLSADELAALGEKMIYPRGVLLANDEECNVACMMCRHKVIAHSDQELAKMSAGNDNILSMLKNAELVYVSGKGDPFSSRYMRALIKQIVQTYPQMKFRVSTNGILASKELFEDLGLLRSESGGDEDRVTQVNFSIHAATEKTYNKIVKGGNWQAVMRNLKWLSERQRAGRIKELFMIFVLSSLNFRELPDFLRLTRQFGANPLIWDYKNWGVQSGLEARNLAVFDPRHRDYPELVEILQDEEIKLHLHGDVFSPALLKAMAAQLRARTPDEIAASKRWHSGD